MTNINENHAHLEEGEQTTLNYVKGVGGCILHHLCLALALIIHHFPLGNATCFLKARKGCQATKLSVSLCCVFDLLVG